MEAPKKPERYTPQEWLEDFAEVARHLKQHKDVQEMAAWMNFHFVTKYLGEDEQHFRLKRFEAAYQWMEANIGAVNEVVGGASNKQQMQITPSVLRMLYVVYGFDHGPWPVSVPLPSMLDLLRKQMAGDTSQGIL